MSRKQHTPEEIITKLREAEIELAKAATTRQTYYRWRKQ